MNWLIQYKFHLFRAVIHHDFDKLHYWPADDCFSARTALCLSKIDTLWIGMWSKCINLPLPAWFVLTALIPRRKYLRTFVTMTSRWHQLSLIKLHSTRASYARITKSSTIAVLLPITKNSSTPTGSPVHIVSLYLQMFDDCVVWWIHVDVAVLVKTPHTTQTLRPHPTPMF